MRYIIPTATLILNHGEPSIRDILRDFTCTEAEIEVKRYIKTATFTHKETGETIRVTLAIDKENGDWSLIEDAESSYEDVNTPSEDESAYDLLDDAIPAKIATLDYPTPFNKPLCPGCSTPGCEPWDEHDRPCR